MREMRENTPIPDVISDSHSVGYWDVYMDFRTGRGNLSKGGPVKSTSPCGDYLFTTIHDNTGSCPSGPIGYIERKVTAITPRAFDAKYRGVVFTPYKNKQVLLRIKGYHHSPSFVRLERSTNNGKTWFHKKSEVFTRSHFLLLENKDANHAG